MKFHNGIIEISPEELNTLGRGESITDGNHRIQLRDEPQIVFVCEHPTGLKIISEKTISGISWRKARLVYLD